MDIRKAEQKDLPNIVELAKMMAEYHHRLDSYYKTAAAYKNLEDDFAAEMEDGDSLMLVAEEGARTVGYFRGMIEPAPAYLSPKKIGVIYDLFVLPEYRNRRIGRELFRRALSWFRERSVKNIELSVDARNKEGVAFWKQNNFFEYKMRLRMDIPKNAD